MSYGLESYNAAGILVFSTASITSNLVGVFVVTIPANAITASITIPGGLVTDDLILKGPPNGSFLSPLVKESTQQGLKVTLNLFHFGSGFYDRRNFPVNYTLTIFRIAL